VPAEPTPPAAPTASEHAALAAGRYLSSRRFERSFLALLNLRAERVEANADATITIPSVIDRDGNPKRWREVAPWTWQEIGGPDRLIMTVAQGRVTMIRRSGDAATVLVRATGARQGPWNQPLLWGTILVTLAEAGRQIVRTVRRRRSPPRKLDPVALIGS